MRIAIPGSIALAVSLSAPAALAAPQAGNDGQQNIVNGAVVEEPDDYYETVFLTIESPAGGGNCTGTLINPTTVLTAAHCFDETTTGIKVAWGRFGNSPDDVVLAADWVQHPDYIPEEDWPANPTNINDIAYVTLRTAKESPVLAALNSDEFDDAFLGREITFVGFGRTATDPAEDEGTGTKRYTTNDIESFVEYEFDTLNEGNEGDTCQGDSGGPSFVSTDDGWYVQVGVTSRGTTPCGTGTGTYTRVDAYLDWLDEEGIAYETRSAAPPTFVCNRRLEEEDENSVAVGVVPFELRCVVDYAFMDTVTEVRWSWGDGGTGTGAEASHVYETDGNYSIRMCVDSERNTGPVTNCYSRISHVRACDLPDVAATYRYVEGMTYQFVNQTDLRTWGCIFDVQWDIFAGSDTTGEPIASLSAWEPQYTFEERGEYTVVLNVGGLAGTSAVRMTIHAGAATCSHVGMGGSSALALLGLAAVAGVRRRRDGR